MKHVVYEKLKFFTVSICSVKFLSSFYSVHEDWFLRLRVLLNLKFSVVSFWNLWDFALVPLDYIAWHFCFFRLQGDRFFSAL